MFSVPVRCTGGKRCAVTGFTLIEVVVALAIFSGMLLLGGMALNQGLKQYSGLVEKGLRFWDYAQRIWMDKSFHSIMDYYVRTDEQGWFPYFHGNQEGISFVTGAPFAGDLPVVVWLREEKTDDEKMRLVYYELPVSVKSYRDLDRDFTSGAYQKGRLMKILEGVEKMQFEYFGYSVRDEKRVWRSVFEGADTREIPELVRIDYMLDGEKKMFMYAVHVNSQMKRGYERKYSQ